MRNINLSDTIVAIATPIGESGIGIVRISGENALIVADKIFKSKDDKKPSSYKTYTTHYGWIVDSSSDSKSEIVDEVILTVMRAPKSYTKEDVVEINCHGGIVALRRALDMALGAGCRLAEPGEFTRRAFLNGRIDLTQAEAVLDIIRAKTDTALRIGQEQLKGVFSAKVNQIRGQILEVLSVLEAGIDFPEESAVSVDMGGVRANLTDIDNQLKEILSTAKHGRILREGIHTVICGRPNVGKSSLLNALLKQERSIVTPIAGTTRDTVEEIIDVKGIPVRIVDTAGIIEPRDLVEKKAVLRSRKQIKLADLVILVFDASARLSKHDLSLMKKLRKKETIVVLNKIDLRQKIDKNNIAPRFKTIVELSAKKSQNIHTLEEAIANLVYGGRVKSPEAGLIASLRHVQAIKEAQKLIAEALNSLDNKLFLEFVTQDIKEALGCLDEVLGRVFSEDLLDKIFSDFCIGK